MLNDCILLGKCFVMKLIESLNKRFTNLSIFNATTFYSRSHYYKEMDDRDSQTKRWLKCLCEKFSVGGWLIVLTTKCLSEMDEFV